MNFDPSSGDQAFLTDNKRIKGREMTYGGALSFLRRQYSRDLDGVDIVISGVPYDCATTYRPGCRLGPRAIRAASVQLAELASFPSGIVLEESLSMIDWGDCFVNPHEPDTVKETIASHARLLLQSSAKMLTFGGDHFVSYPLIAAHAEKYGPVALLQVDAHCDTWPEEEGEINHGNMFLRAAREGIVDVARSTQLGLRTSNDHDHGFEILTSPWVHRNGVDAAIDVIRARAGDAPLYISFDIDSLDPAFAPGTGTPVSGGLASWQALELMRGIGSLNLIGMDLVEVSPPYDHAEITAIAAASIAVEWLVQLALQAGAEARLIGRL